MVKRSDWIVTIVLLFGFVAVILMVFNISFNSGSYRSNLRTPGSKIAIVNIKVPIYSSERFVEQLNKFNKENSIKGIVIRMDTPGGSVAATQEIFEAVKRVKQNNKKIVVSMGNIAASGGYYISCGADIIMANPSTITGSIGVIAEFPNFKGLYDKIGVKFETIKSGKFKDTGSPNRNMTNEEKDYFQILIDDSYMQFVEVVAQARNLPTETVIKLADGRVYSGRQAKNVGLVDTLGTLQDAILLAKRIAGLKADAPVIEERRRRISLFDLLLGDFEEILYILRKDISLDYILN